MDYATGETVGTMDPRVGAGPETAALAIAGPGLPPDERETPRSVLPR